jgi:uncharacterized PurR-regulated membrane protein YhhQ (DUF165 family)
VPWFVLYVVAAAAANVITAATVPAEIGPFLVTWGTWIVGVTFVLRDAVHVRLGKRAAYAAIGCGLVAAAVVSAALGDTLLVVAGSALAFGVSESADAEVFSRMRARVSSRVAVSGLVGGTLDSAIFAVVGLGLSGIVPWSALPNVIAGQIIVKGTVQLVAAGAWRAWWPEPREAPAEV